jgi:hypothetical protein
VKVPLAFANGNQTILIAKVTRGDFGSPL